MKNIKLLLLFAFTLLYFSCSNSELNAAKKRLEERKSKTEFAIFLLDHGTNTRVLGEKIGLKKDLQKFMKIQSDTTVSCDS
jgi:hypothetical protein